MARGWGCRLGQATARVPWPVPCGRQHQQTGRERGQPASSSGRFERALLGRRCLPSFSVSGKAAINRSINGLFMVLQPWRKKTNLTRLFFG